LKASLATWNRLGDLSLLVVFVGATLAAATQFAWVGLARFPKWQRSLGALGAVLVLAGIGGEILSASNSRNINEQIAAALNARAAAAVAASNALEREITQLRLQLAKLKWRVIAPEQEAALIAWLKKAPKGPVLVLYRADDEPASYAAQIKDAFRAAGFDAKVQQSQLASNLSGTWLLVQDLQQPPPHAVPIQAAFREIHIDLDAQPDPQYVPSAETVVILVGSRRL
jgi:cell division protein FtsB